MIATPIRISGLPQSLLNSARAASVAWVSGLRLLRNRSQSGASAIGSRIPDSRSSGITRLWTSGANASSLLRISAAAYDSGATTSPMSASSAEASRRRPATSMWRPNGIASTDHEQRLEEQDHDVPERSPEEHRGPAHRRDPHPLDDAVAELGDQPEAAERRPEQRDLDRAGPARTSCRR